MRCWHGITKETTRISESVLFPPSSLVLRFINIVMHLGVCTLFFTAVWIYVAWLFFSGLFGVNGPQE